MIIPTILLIISIVIVSTFIARLIVSSTPETMAPEPYKPVTPEFEAKTERMFNEVKRRNPHLKDKNVELKIKRNIEHHGTRAYGRHVAIGINNYHIHKIEIAADPIKNDNRLYETVCHEFAHMADVMNRGKSAHDTEFHEEMDRIKNNAPLRELT